MFNDEQVTAACWFAIVVIVVVVLVAMASGGGKHVRHFEDDYDQDRPICYGPRDCE